MLPGTGLAAAGAGPRVRARARAPPPPPLTAPGRGEQGRGGRSPTRELRATSSPPLPPIGRFQVSRAPLAVLPAPSPGAEATAPVFGPPLVEQLAQVLRLGRRKARVGREEVPEPTCLATSARRRVRHPAPRPRAPPAVPPRTVLPPPLARNSPEVSADPRGGVRGGGARASRPSYPSLPPPRPCFPDTTSYPSSSSALGEGEREWRRLREWNIRGRLGHHKSPSFTLTCGPPLTSSWLFHYTHSPAIIPGHTSAPLAVQCSPPVPGSHLSKSWTRTHLSGRLPQSKPLYSDLSFPHRPFFAGPNGEFAYPLRTPGRHPVVSHMCGEGEGRHSLRASHLPVLADRPASDACLPPGTSIHASGSPAALQL
ncbi:formin-like protein 6 [Eumetopias jubatus]|uniref:formin-like protein 6 n=1 Tax=Eumetopias jubatus TaxID=34886 RepID=UPI00101603A0|nr:formin-like protein 6 [Eumetopias jubatus]